MKSSSFVNRALIVLLLTCITVGLCAQKQTHNNGFVPHIGQEGKDVIWVPTPDELVNKMLEIAEVTAKDFLIDLGSGDGRTVIAAAKLGARALGIEYNPDMVELSKKNAEEAGVSGKTKFIQADLFECDLSEATVITMFLLPEINLKLRPRLLDLKPGTRIVSNTFTMGDWEPDFEVTTEENWNSWYTALMWIVPAKIEGNWKLEGGELTIRQEFQMLYGTFKTDNKTSNITDGRLTDDVITFSFDGATYTGHVKGTTTMVGTVTTSSSKRDWIATRTE
ncbi:MAG: class I SAM-dependent methyltransferase [Thermoplasmata archaeon]|nr:class I SAM-dependent methyltransferase [Thermoplasmata archaeon]